VEYRIESIDLFVRETPPGRMAVAIGKQPAAGETPEVPEPTTNPIAHVRLMLSDRRGRRAFGCSGDRLSVRWLDKRPERTEAVKVRGLVELVCRARDVYLESPAFTSAFEKWLAAYEGVAQAGREMKEEDLSAAFASALMERALLDAVCRLEGKSIFEMVREDRLGFRPGQVHAELDSVRLHDALPERPLTRFHVRHTVGLVDPITAADLPEERRVNDGQPETLDEYVRRDGLRYFKVKIGGDPERDLERLARVWKVLPREPETAVTLDANEAYEDLAIFADFAGRLERGLTGLWQHVLYIEQPLPRALSLDPRAETWIRRVGERKPVIIDEAEGTLDAFPRALALGYAGTSHKNCKGFFKSLLNRALIVREAREGRRAFLSGEDLQNLPVVPLHQDFAALGVLGLPHCERNGHHYNFGLSMLPMPEKEQCVRHHPDLYVRRGEEWFLNVRNGMVRCASLQGPGFGVRFEPDWSSMTDMQRWVKVKYPAGCNEAMRR
jgi:hypothetical protein